MYRPDLRILWARWVIANAFGEMIGLGLTFLLIAWITTRVGEGTTPGAVLAAFFLSVLSGALEATIIGLGQWWAMSPWFPAITRSAWWLATLGGALAAYILGYLPTTLMSMGEQPSQVPAAEPPQWIVLLLAAGLGLAAGAVLSFAQWIVLKKNVEQAGLWIPANMLAWAAGMPVIFWGIDAAQKGQPLLQAVVLLAGVLFLTGAIVGAIHGAFLTRLATKTKIENLEKMLERRVL